MGRRHGSPAKASRAGDNPVRLTLEPEAETPQSRRKATNKKAGGGGARLSASSAGASPGAAAAREEAEMMEFAGGPPPGGGNWRTSSADELSGGGEQQPPQRSMGSPAAPMTPMQREVTVMQRLSDRLEAAAAAEEQLAGERVSRLRALEQLRETEAALTSAQLIAAQAIEARIQAEKAKEAISEKFEEHVSAQVAATAPCSPLVHTALTGSCCAGGFQVRDAEDNIQMLREELSSCTGELWQAVSAAKAAAAASEASATEARAERDAVKEWGRGEAGKNTELRRELTEADAVAQEHASAVQTHRSAAEAHAQTAEELKLAHADSAANQKRTHADTAADLKLQLEEAHQALATRDNTRAQETAEAARELTALREQCNVANSRASSALEESSRQVAELDLAEERRKADVNAERKGALQRAAGAMEAESGASRAAAAALAGELETSRQLRAELAAVRAEAARAAEEEAVDARAAKLRAAAWATEEAVAATQAAAARARAAAPPSPPKPALAPEPAAEPATVDEHVSEAQPVSAHQDVLEAMALTMDPALVQVAAAEANAIEAAAAAKLDEVVGTSLSPRSADQVTRDLKTAAANGDAPAVTEILSTTGVDLEADLGRDGRTALWVAASSGHTEVVEVLARSGANLNPVCTQTLFTALHSAGKPSPNLSIAGMFY